MQEIPSQTQRAVAQVHAARGAGRISAGGADNIVRWLTAPHYARYVPALLDLLSREDYRTLDEAFWEVIPFGTGGRRGPMAEIGSATINERTIAESAHGLAVYLKQQIGVDARLAAAVGFDTRHRSEEFARITATTLAAHGIKVFLFDGCRATPELSFAVRHLGCGAGVMISASHNPPSDNGFKAYWSNGGQVLPPHDRGIIECVYAAGEIPAVPYDEAVANGRIVVIGDEVDRDYVAAVADLGLSDARQINALYTPLHGVGETSIACVLRESGFHGVEIFEPQRTRDGGFPNVPDRLPNPERPEVFGPAVEYGSSRGFELILASDPDADRLGVAVRGRSGTFVPLTGNQLGALLTDYVLRKRSAAGTLSREHYVVATLVTTPLIRRIGRAHRVRVEDMLPVGFKYIAQAMDEIGPELFVFGAEESLGYLAGQYCRDKDAAIAALYVMELAAELAAEGRTLLDRLDELYVEHGYYLEAQRSETCKGPRGKEQIAAIMQALRTSPPAQLGDARWARVDDFKAGEVRRLPANTVIGPLSGDVPYGDLLVLQTADDDLQFTVAARPSGTEPKIKFYFFAGTGCPVRAALAAVERETAAALLRVQDALSAWVRQIIGAA